ncbi:uncharacterized protein LOC131935429 [Physella acuta]|uniref:uncharacterized protein LOC131935429 n=1 Tax=Physella acuta TaxID=109671 RepID=UPI0027DC3EB5|nr:uncharacterized protein LOC131935429 [Physella acuta]
MEESDVKNSTAVDTSPLYISEEVLAVFTLVSNCSILLVISFFGVVFNIINMAVFTQMGLTDPVNITLLGLALSDMGACLMLMLLGVFSHPTISLQYGVYGYFMSWPHIGFSRVSSWLTVYITFERYICIAFPLKVKRIITTARTVMIVISIFSIFAASVTPALLVLRIVEYPISGTNLTYVYLGYTPDGREVENVAVTFNNIALFLSFPSVIVCTILIVIKLNAKTKWRSESSSSSKNESVTLRDKKVVKMVTFLACNFILSYIPAVVATIGMVSTSDYSALGSFSRFFSVSWSLIFCIESTNSAVNIFVYLKMSSRYKSVFLAMFGFNVQVPRAQAD